MTLCTKTIYNYLYANLFLNVSRQDLILGPYKKRQRTQVYYAHPYSAWERGSNENLNRMIRRFIPKGSDISSFTKPTAT